MKPNSSPGIRRAALLAGAVVVSGAAIIAFSPPDRRAHWLRLLGGQATQETDHGAADAHDHDAAHDHANAADPNSLVLSPQALHNLGLTDDYIQPVQLTTYFRTITVPAIVVERPGRTRLEVATPMAGVVTHVHAVQGEAVTPGSLLFELRITAEELVATQTALLQTLGELDVEKKEIARLTEVSQSGAIAQTRLLDRKYAQERLEAMLTAHKEALRLQGLSDRQIAGIESERRLLRDLRIFAPSPDEHSHDEFELSANTIAPASFLSDDSVMPNDDGEDLLVLQDLRVHKGEIVAAGATLAIAADLGELLIEGQAFERDGNYLSAAAARNWKVRALVERAGQPAETITDLELLYSANAVDVASRTLRFYVRLPNTIVRRSPSPNRQQYIEWKYRIGQRMQLQVPVEVWEQQLVVPVEAIAQEGPETFLFQQNGKRFQRIPVSIEFRDQTHAVLKHDGSVFPGDRIALRGAHQMQMALKNQAGGGVDPHAGHSH